MPFSGGCSVVSGGLELLDESEGFGGERPVKLFRSRIVWISAGDNTGATGTARVRSEIGVLESETGLGESVDVWGFDGRMPVGAAIVPVHVIGDDEDNVWLVRCDKRTEEQEEQREGFHYLVMRVPKASTSIRAAAEMGGCIMVAMTF